MCVCRIYIYIYFYVCALGWSELGHWLLPELCAFCINASVEDICSYGQDTNGEILRPTVFLRVLSALLSQRTESSRFVDPVPCEVFFSQPQNQIDERFIVLTWWGFWGLVWPPRPLFAKVGVFLPLSWVAAGDGTARFVSLFVLSPLALIFLWNLLWRLQGPFQA